MRKQERQRKRERSGRRKSDARVYARARRRLSIILRNNFETRRDEPSEFQQTFRPLLFYPFLPSFFLFSLSLSLFLDLVLRRDTAAGDKFRIPVVLLVTVPEASLLLSFMHYRRSLPFYRPSTESDDVVLVHSYFGTNIMLIPAGAPVARRCLSPREERNIDVVCRWLSADKDRATATHTRLPRMLS